MAVRIPVAQAEIALDAAPWRRVGGLRNDAVDWSELSFALPPCGTSWGCHAGVGFDPDWALPERCVIGPFEWRHEGINGTSAPESFRGPIACERTLWYRISATNDIVHYRCGLRDGGALRIVDAAFRLLPTWGATREGGRAASRIKVPLPAQDCVLDRPPANRDDPGIVSSGTFSDELE